MKKKRLYFLLYITFIVVLGFPEFIPESRADLIYVNRTGIGNFLPESDVPLKMTNASVVFNIDAVNYRKKINLNFSGNYTIYNPVEAKNLTLVAPFSTDFINLESSCVIKIENTTIPYYFLEYNFTLSPWEEYLDSRYIYGRKFIVINVTVPENDSKTIEYSFDAYIDGLDSYDAVDICYDVGTSRAWNGTITERVEFKVYGKRPDSYSAYRKDYFEYNCTISDIEDGYSYLWEWENEIINVNSVYIAYFWSNYWGGRIFFILIFILVYGSIAAVCISLLLLRRKRKRIKRNFS